jgi:hypothetical protein
MKKDKANRKAADKETPVSSSKKDNQSATQSAGTAESTGGSREGNIGHENNPNTGKGHRQV